MANIEQKFREACKESGLASMLNQLNNPALNGLFSATLNILKQKGYRLAVASNKYQAATERIIGHFFPNIFDCALGERDGVPRKPDPQIVSDILSGLGSENAKQPLFYIGDSLVDMQTAHNACVPFIACSWGFVPRQQLVEASVEQIADSPTDILKFIR